MWTYLFVTPFKRTGIACGRAIAATPIPNPPISRSVGEGAVELVAREKPAS